MKFVNCRAAICRTLLIVAIVVSSTGSLAAQEKKINFFDRKVTVQSALSEIKRQTGYLMAINHEDLDNSRTVVLSARSLPLSQALDEILTGSRHTHMITATHIFIVQGDGPEILLPVEPSPKGSADLPLPAIETPAPLQFEDPILSMSEMHLDVIPMSNDLSKKYDAINIKADPPVFRNSPPVFAIKTNFVQWAALGTLNIGTEIGLGKRTSLDLHASWNPWNLKGSEENNKKLVHWTAVAEFRYWFCERYNGHFLGVHPFYWRFNINEHKVPLLFEKDVRNDGNAFGFGISYGYHWMLGRSWGMEFNLGVGVAFMNYKTHECAKCGDVLESKKKTYFGPTRVGVSLVYLINKNK